MTTAPRSTAERDRRAEPNLPTGVLTAATITERVMSGTFLRWSLRWWAVASWRRRTHEGGRTGEDHHVGPGHRGRALCAVDRRPRQAPRRRHRGRRPPDGLLARAHARGDVPAVG